MKKPVLLESRPGKAADLAFPGCPVLSAGPRFGNSINDWINDSGLLDSAFGGGDAAVSLDQLLPGMPVRLVLSPVSGKVQYLSVQRELALGRLAQADPQSRKLQLEFGGNLTWLRARKLFATNSQYC